MDARAPCTTMYVIHIIILMYTAFVYGLVRRCPASLHRRPVYLESSPFPFSAPLSQDQSPPRRACSTLHTFDLPSPKAFRPCAMRSNRQIHRWIQTLLEMQGQTGAAGRVDEDRSVFACENSITLQRWEQCRRHCPFAFARPTEKSGFEGWDG